MDKLNFIRLIDTYLDGSASEADKALLEAYYVRLGAEDFPALTKAQEDALEEMMYSQIMAQRNTSIPGKPEPGLKLWPFMSSKAGLWKVAAAVAAITLGTWLYRSAVILNSVQDPNAVATTNDIAPGRNTATLTLASGKVINLDTNRTNVVVTDSVKTFVMLTASTPRGGTYQITLPDGTEVWLNADSKISFPSQFTGAKRQITLEGEAYFQVAKMTLSSLRGRESKDEIATARAELGSVSRKASRNDERVPFIVESKGQQVEVLGTHFNINAYPDEGATKTTLLEGSVRVSSLLTSSSLRGRTSASRGNLPGRGPSTESRAATILKPNQQAVLTATNIEVKQIDPAEAVAWKNNEFVLDGESIESIMRKVERWYDVEVVYEGKKPTEKFVGVVSRLNNVSEVLKMLEKTGDVTFKIEGRRIIVK